MIESAWLVWTFLSAPHVTGLQVYNTFVLKKHQVEMKYDFSFFVSLRVTEVISNDVFLLLFGWNRVIIWPACGRDMAREYQGIFHHASDIQRSLLLLLDSGYGRRLRGILLTYFMCNEGFTFGVAQPVNNIQPSNSCLNFTDTNDGKNSWLIVWGVGGWGWRLRSDLPLRPPILEKPQKSVCRLCKVVCHPSTGWNSH